MFIGLRSVCTIGSFGESLASNSKRPINCVSLKNQPSQAWPTLIVINSNEAKLIHKLSVKISEVEVAILLMMHIL